MPETFYRATPEYRRAAFGRGLRQGFVAGSLIGWVVGGAWFAGYVNGWW